MLKALPTLSDAAATLRRAVPRARMTTMARELTAALGQLALAASQRPVNEDDLLPLRSVFQPYHNNFNKRIIKTPKLFFYDTGIVCSLLGLNRSEDVLNYHGKGALFENFVITEVVKSHYNRGIPLNLWFWQDQSGKEIDLLLQVNIELYAVEVKAGKTFNMNYFHNISSWQKISGVRPENCAVVYGGDTSFQTSLGKLISWRESSGQMV